MQKRQKGSFTKINLPIWQIQFFVFECMKGSSYFLKSNEYKIVNVLCLFLLPYKVIAHQSHTVKWMWVEDISFCESGHKFGKLIAYSILWKVLSAFDTDVFSVNLSFIWIPYEACFHGNKIWIIFKSFFQSTCVHCTCRKSVKLVISC